MHAVHADDYIVMAAKSRNLSIGPLAHSAFYCQIVRQNLGFTFSHIVPFREEYRMHLSHIIHSWFHMLDIWDNCLRNCTPQKYEEIVTIFLVNYLCVKFDACKCISYVKKLYCVLWILMKYFRVLSLKERMGGGSTVTFLLDNLKLRWKHHFFGFVV